MPKFKALKEVKDEEHRKTLEAIIRSGKTYGQIEDILVCRIVDAEGKVVQERFIINGRTRDNAIKEGVTEKHLGNLTIERALGMRSTVDFAKKAESNKRSEDIVELCKYLKGSPNPPKVGEYAKKIHDEYLSFVSLATVTKYVPDEFKDPRGRRGKKEPPITFVIASSKFPNQYIRDIQEKMGDKRALDPTKNRKEIAELLIRFIYHSLGLHKEAIDKLLT